MWSAIKFQWQIRALNRQRDRVERIHAANRKALKDSGLPIPSFSPEEWNEQNAINADIYKLETGYLLRRAAREKVPLPDSEDEDSWIEAVGGGYFLSQTAYSNLRAAIRKEQNERWQWWELRTKLIVTLVTSLATALTGLVGALIGWAAFFKK